MVCLTAPIAANGAICQHCGRAKVNRPRGLCWTCYYTDGVKDKYPSTSKYARRGEGNFNGNAPLPEPTAAAPGTPEKLEVLAMRARLKQALWHPLDVSEASDPRTAGLVRAMAG